MGRTAKFTFPIPGRKQKQPAPSPSATVSAPLTKAQKILGTAELNVDSPILSKDHARFWETRSNSGISISISETTAGFTNDTVLGRLDEGEVIHGVGGRHARWEDESAIIPRGRNATTSRADTVTDASSVRRQRSSSTINTYYDKSKVPLSISQQTASSAIAKGPPAKASALLDMDGSYNVDRKPPKKKPSRLDLSHLLPKNMSARHLAPLDVAQKNHVLGPDLMTRSPSVMSVSPDIASPAQQPSHRKPRKKLTLETLRDHWLESTTNPEPPKMRTASSVNELHNLYEHYEQRSFEDMRGKKPAAANTGAGSPRYGSSPVSAQGGRDFLSPYSNTAPRTVLASRDGSDSQVSGAETPTTSLMTPSSLNSRPADSASVSSRHTRTSKASKRTDNSMTDFDLRQNSVLSLSSDEDDYDDRTDTSLLSASKRLSSSQPSPTSPNLSCFPQPPSPQVIDANSRTLPLRRAGPALPDSRTQFVPLENPARNTEVAPPKIAARRSSLFASSGGTQKATTSRFSLASTATARSATPGPTASSARSDNTAQEFRPIALIPAQNFRHQSNSQQQSAHRRGTRLSTASDQSTSLSPTSMDFYLQSQHNSVAFDSGSVRSGMSIGTTGGASFRSSVSSSVAGDDASGRFIAVTRQEEMLLAALRNKRARMRDEIIAEFEEGHGDPTGAEDGSLHHPPPQHRYEERTLQTIQSAPPPTKQQLRSWSNRSSGRQTSRNSSLSTVRLASLPEQPYGESQQLRPPPSTTLAPAPRKTSGNISDKPSHKKEQVLLRIEHPVGKIGATDLPEPSPDLDDFSDLYYLGGDVASPGITSDTGSLTFSGSGSARSPTSSHLREADLFPAVPTGRSNKSAYSSGGGKNATLPKLSLQTRQGGRVRVVDDVHVRILGEGGSSSSGGAPDENDMDIPRPDSPISPAADLPLPSSQLPRKKQVRLSAVGYRPMEAGLWGDDG
jgi:hypothetical protein